MSLLKDDYLDQMEANDDADSDTESTAKAAPEAKPDGSSDEKPDNDKEVKGGGERNPFAFMKSFRTMTFMSPPRESERGRRGFSRPSSALSGDTPEEAAAVAAEGEIREKYLREAPLQKPLVKSKTEPFGAKMKSFLSTPSAGSVFAARAEGVDRKAAGLPSTDNAEDVNHEASEAEGGDAGGGGDKAEVAEAGVGAEATRAVGGEAEAGRVQAGEAEVDTEAEAEAVSIITSHANEVVAGIVANALQVAVAAEQEEVEARASPSSNGTTSSSFLAAMDVRAKEKSTTSSSFLAAMDVRAKDVAETRASPSSKPSDCQSKQAEWPTQAEWAERVGRRISDDLRSQITQLI